MSPPAPPLCGVRRTRGGPLVVADPGGYILTPGQLVVIEDSRGQHLATVVIGSDQLIENEPEQAPTTRVVRPATQEDAEKFGRLSAEDLGVRRRAEAELAVRIEDAWLSTDGSRLITVCPESDEATDTLARQLTGLFGLPVDVLRRAADGSLRAASGVLAAGLPQGWAEWLAGPGETPSVKDLRGIAADPSARDFIDRLFSEVC